MFHNEPVAGRMTREKAQPLLSLAQRIRADLDAAQTKLRSARNWGMADMLGGKFVTNLVKHNQLKEALAYMAHARPLMQELERACAQFSLGVQDVGASGFAVFADFVFDGILADVYMQNKIREMQVALARAQQQLQRVEDMLRGAQGAWGVEATT